MKTLSILLLLTTAPLIARDFFVTPDGAGTKGAASIENAAPGSAISTLFDKMAPGDRILLGAGDYAGVTITLRTGGSAEKPKIIEGTDGTSFTSDWTIEKPEKGSTAITLAPGLSDVVIKNLSIRHHCFAVRAQPSKDAPRTRIAFENIAIAQVRHGFYLSDCDDLSLTGCTMKRYSKHGFRFEQGCDRVTVKHCIADCSEADAQWETKTEIFPFGFLIGDGDVPNSSLRFEDCVARNNIKSNQTVKYTNGDGFVAEGKNRDVTFVRCHALRNQDGGFDIKVKDATFTGCIATGHRRDFRIWNSGTLENCFAGSSQTGLWIKEGSVTAKHMSFLNHRKSSVELDDPAAATVTLSECLLASAQPGYEASIGKYDASGTVAAKTPDEAGLPKDDPAWNGEGDSMNSTKFRDKGFSSLRVRR